MSHNHNPGYVSDEGDETEDDFQRLHLFRFETMIGVCGNDEGPYTFDPQKVTCAACRQQDRPRRSTQR